MGASFVNVDFYVVECNRLRNEVDSLTASLRQAEAKSDRLSACLAEVTDKLSARSADLAGNSVALATERAAREEAEQLAVWAVRHGAFINDEIPDKEAVIGYWEPNYFHGEPEQDICDSTDAGILAALRRAMEGEE